jgi:hypothetical protein
VPDDDAVPEPDATPQKPNVTYDAIEEALQRGAARTPLQNTGQRVPEENNQ